MNKSILTAALVAIVAISAYGAEDAYAQSAGTIDSGLMGMITESHMVTGFIFHYMVIGAMGIMFVGAAWKYGITWLRGHNLVGVNATEEVSKTAHQTPTQFAANPTFAQPAYLNAAQVPPPAPYVVGQQQPQQQQTGSS